MLSALFSALSLCLEQYLECGWCLINIVIGRQRKEGLWGFLAGLESNERHVHSEVDRRQGAAIAVFSNW